jgi:hypothetical protein
VAETISSQRADDLKTRSSRGKVPNFNVQLYFFFFLDIVPRLCAVDELSAFGLKSSRSRQFGHSLVLRVDATANFRYDLKLFSALTSAASRSTSVCWLARTRCLSETSGSRH